MNENSIIKNLKSDLISLLIPTAILALLFTFIKMADTNQSLFLQLNQVSLYSTKYLWAFFTLWGDALLSTIILIPFIKKRPDILWAGLIGAILCGLTINMLKNGYGVKRPTAVLSLDEFIHIGRMVKNRSFPSGHSATAFWLAGTIAFSFRNIKVTATVLILASLIAFSRIAVGVHWPLDVIMGSMIGWLYGYFGHFIYGMFIKNKMIKGVRVFMILFTLLAFYTAFLYDAHYPGVINIQIVGATLLGLWGLRESITMFKTKSSNELHSS